MKTSSSRTQERILEEKVRRAKVELDRAREHGDPLRIELAEDALNDLLDRLGLAYQS